MRFDDIDEAKVLRLAAGMKEGDPIPMPPVLSVVGTDLAEGRVVRSPLHVHCRVPKGVDRATVTVRTSASGSVCWAVLRGGEDRVRLEDLHDGTLRIVALRRKALAGRSADGSCRVEVGCFGKGAAMTSMPALVTVSFAD